MDTVKLLEKKLQTKIEELDGLKPGSEEHKAKLEEISKLGIMLKDLKQVEVDEIDKRDNYFLKVEQAENEKKDRKFMKLLDIGKFVGAGVLAYWTFRFDEKGTITSTLGKNIVNKCIPRK